MKPNKSKSTSTNKSKNTKGRKIYHANGIIPDINEDFLIYIPPTR